MQREVSCVLVTRNRRRFFGQAVKNLLAQTYAAMEVIIVDDGEDSVADLCPPSPRIHYIRLNAPTPTGEKLNIGIEAARSEILQKIDDDDFYGPEFIATSMNHLPQPADPETLVAWCCFGVLVAGQGEPFFSGHGWHSGGTYCFSRSMWKRKPFRAVFASSDTWFLKDHQPKIIRACASDQYVVVRHGANTWNHLEGQISPDDYFLHRERYPKTMEQIVGPENIAFYRELMNRPYIPS